jgi:hypothetical protein
MLQTPYPSAIYQIQSAPKLKFSNSFFTIFTTIYYSELPHKKTTKKAMDPVEWLFKRAHTKISTSCTARPTSSGALSTLCTDPAQAN